MGTSVDYKNENIHIPLLIHPAKIIACDDKSPDAEQKKLSCIQAYCLNGQLIDVCWGYARTVSVEIIPMVVADTLKDFCSKFESALNKTNVQPIEWDGMQELITVLKSLIINFLDKQKNVKDLFEKKSANRTKEETSTDVDDSFPIVNIKTTLFDLIEKLKEADGIIEDFINPENANKNEQNGTQTKIKTTLKSLKGLHKDLEDAYGKWVESGKIESGYIQNKIRMIKSKYPHLSNSSLVLLKEISDQWDAIKKKLIPVTGGAHIDYKELKDATEALKKNFLVQEKKSLIKLK